jgi:hypothetical protein
MSRVQSTALRLASKKAAQEWCKTCNELSLKVDALCSRYEKRLRALNEVPCDDFASAIYQCWKEFDTALHKRIKQIEAGRYSRSVENRLERLKPS